MTAARVLTDEPQPSARPDAELGAAFDELVRQHRTALVNYATRLSGGDRSAGEDIVQEAFVRAWRNLPALIASGGSVRGWLTRVTHNLSVDRHRARHARPAEVPCSGDEPIAAPDRHADVLTSIDVAHALDTLPDEQRTALAATVLSDRTVAEAALLLGVPVGTVKSRVFYGLRRLRSHPGLLATAS